MTEEEKTILLEIDNLYLELLNEQSGTWNGNYMMKPSGHNYRYKAEKLKAKVFELYDKHNPDYLTQHHIDAIAHTCDKEVSYVEYHYGLSIKNNAPKKRYTEFIDSMNIANQQIRRDIFSVFFKIKEIKM
jgi:hypothetical protein